MECLCFSKIQARKLRGPTNVMGISVLHFTPGLSQFHGSHPLAEWEQLWSPLLVALLLLSHCDQNSQKSKEIEKVCLVV